MGEVFCGWVEWAGVSVTQKTASGRQEVSPVGYCQSHKRFLLTYSVWSKWREQGVGEMCFLCQVGNSNVCCHLESSDIVPWFTGNVKIVILELKRSISLDGRIVFG